MPEGHQASPSLDSALPYLGKYQTSLPVEWGWWLPADG